MFSFIGDVSAAIASSYNYDGGGAAAAAFWAIYLVFILVFSVGGYVLSSLFLMKSSRRPASRASGAPGFRSTTS